MRLTPFVRRDCGFLSLLQAAFEQFEADSESKVAVLYGDGGTFCSGADLKAVATGGPTMNELTDVESGGRGPMGPSRMVLSKPLIAAISGYAVAGGLELALWADLRVVEEDAVLGVFCRWGAGLTHTGLAFVPLRGCLSRIGALWSVTNCRRWGVPLIDGGTVRLPRLIGLSRALDLIRTCLVGRCRWVLRDPSPASVDPVWMLLQRYFVLSWVAVTGRPVTASEALSMGLANRVVAKGTARASAESLARDIAALYVDAT